MYVTFIVSFEIGQEISDTVDVEIPDRPTLIKPLGKSDTSSLPVPVVVPRYAYDKVFLDVLMSYHDSTEIATVEKRIEKIRNYLDAEMTGRLYGSAELIDKITKVNDYIGTNIATAKNWPFLKMVKKSMGNRTIKEYAADINMSERAITEFLEGRRGLDEHLYRKIVKAIDPESGVTAQMLRLAL